MERTKQKVAVLYHAECPDGFGGAWVAWKKYGNDALYIPVRHNEPYPEEIHGKDVYLIDFCYPEDITATIKKNVAGITVIDHHISNKNVVEGLTQHLFDNNHSGAVLSWMYFFPDKEIPRLLRYVEDIDLWKFNLPSSEEVNSAISSYDLDFQMWDTLVSDCETDEGLKKYVNEGTVLKRRFNKTVRAAVEMAEEIDFEGYHCLLVNSSTATSHIGNELVKKMPPIGIVWSRRGNKIIISLRSDGSVDVSELAKRYGGGGHRSVAGFSWREEHFLVFKGRIGV